MVVESTYTIRSRIGEDIFKHTSNVNVSEFGSW